MILDLGARLSDSPLVETIYRARSVGGGPFISRAFSHWEMVFTRQAGKTTLSLRGPETVASPAPIPEDAEFLGIVFKHGVFMPNFPKQNLVNEELHLPETLRNSFQWQGSTWQFPDFENADTFVRRLQREGLLVQDSVVEDVLNGQTGNLSLRSLQRRFLYVTGVTYKMIQQIERARQALALLQSGVPIADVAFQAGYFDQPHLTRSLKLFAGQTPAQIVKSGQSE